MPPKFAIAFEVFQFKFSYVMQRLLMFVCRDNLSAYMVDPAMMQELGLLAVLACAAS
jgi:hypothetical protein